MLDFRNNESAIIKGTYEPPDGIQSDRKMVYLRYSHMKNGRYINGVNIESLWDKWEKQYEAWRPPKSADDWQSNVVPPFTTTMVERALSEMVDQTLQPMIRGRGPEDVPKAKLLNHIKDYTWEIGDGDLELYAALKQMLVLGKTVWQEDYWKDKRIVKVMKKFNPKTNKEEYVEREVYDFDDVYGENVDLREFFIDPQARHINMGRYKANDCIRRFIMNFDTFQENFINSVYDQFGVAKLVRPGGDLNYYQFYKPPEGIDKDNQVEVLFYWGRRPDKLIVVANDVVVRDGPNPFNHKQLPFAEGSDVPRLSGFYANGEPKLLESIQDELTTMRRMRIDRQHMDLFKMFMVARSENLDEDEGIIAPSRFLEVEDPDHSIKALEYGDINPSAYREEELLKQDGRQVTGIESPQPSGTATEAAIFKESTMKSLRMKIWLVSRQLLTGVVRLRVPNIVQYYSVPKVQRLYENEESEGEMKPQYRQIRTTDMELKSTRDGQLIETEKKGDFFFIVNPEMITPQYGGFDFKLSAEPTFPVSKPLMQQKVNELMQHPVVQAAIEQGYYDVGKIADQMLELNDFDPERFKMEQQGGEEPMVDEQQLLELANRENEIMAQGKKVPPTPYATRSHTDIHMAFMESDKFKEVVGKLKAQGLAEQLIKIFSDHVLGEEAAQKMRGGQPGATQPGMEKTVSQGIMTGKAKSAQPAKMVGGEEAPMSQMT